MPARLLAIALAASLAVGPLPAQQVQDIDYSLSNGSFWNLGIYKVRDIPEADLADSPRLDRLIRNGKLYLSLADALALALENNLDIAIARYSPLEAQADLLRAKAGANLSGVQTQISTLSTGQSVGGGGGGGQGPAGQATGITQSASQAVQTAAGGAGNAASFFGTQTINLDPVITSTLGLNRTSNPQISSALGAFLLTRARARDADSAVQRIVINLTSKYPDLIQLHSTSDYSKNPWIRPRYRCDTEGMRMSRGFLNDYEINQSGYTFHVLNNARVDNSLLELVQVLEAVLGTATPTSSP